MLKKILGTIGSRYLIAFLNLALIFINAKVLGIEGVGMIGLIVASVNIGSGRTRSGRTDPGGSGDRNHVLRNTGRQHDCLFHEPLLHADNFPSRISVDTYRLFPSLRLHVSYWAFTHRLSAGYLLVGDLELYGKRQCPLLVG